MATNRECGDCTACCFHLPVIPIDKPADQACRYQCTEGCSIYMARPDACRQYSCSWLDGDLHEDLKPNECGILFEKMFIKWPMDLYVLMGIEHREGAIQKYHGQLAMSTRPGLLIEIVPFDRSPQTIQFAANMQDVENFKAFIDQCRKEGKITGKYLDQDVDITL